MLVTNDITGDDFVSPLVNEADVVGMYRPDRASAAARETKSGDSWIVILDD